MGRNVQKNRRPGKNSFQAILRITRRSLSKFNFTPLEERLSLTIPLQDLPDFAVPAAAVLSAFQAQTEYLVRHRKDVTLENLLGGAGGGHLLRKALLYHFIAVEGHPKPTVWILLPKGHSKLGAVEAFFTEGTKKVLADEYFGKGGSPALPKFAFEPMGLEAGGTLSHAPAAWKAIADRREARKAAEGAKT
jgi:hypothetical protein